MIDAPQAVSWHWVGTGSLVLVVGVVFAFLCSIPLWNRRYQERLVKARSRIPWAEGDVGRVRVSVKRTAIAGIAVGGILGVVGLVLAIANGFLS